MLNMIRRALKGIKIVIFIFFKNLMILDRYQREKNASGKWTLYVTRR
jgi:hypothetical protein